MTLGLTISIGGLLTPVLGVLADATSLHLAVTVLAAFPVSVWCWACGCTAASQTPPAVPPCNSAPRL